MYQQTTIVIRGEQPTTTKMDRPDDTSLVIVNLSGAGTVSLVVTDAADAAALAQAFTTAARLLGPVPVPVPDPDAQPGDDAPQPA